MTDEELNARFEAVYAASRPAKVIDVYTPSFSQRWNDAPFMTQCAAILLMGFFLPMLILVGGIILLAVWTAIRG